MLVLFWEGTGVLLDRFYKWNHWTVSKDLFLQCNKNRKRSILSEAMWETCGVVLVLPGRPAGLLFQGLCQMILGRFSDDSAGFLWAGVPVGFIWATFFDDET